MPKNNGGGGEDTVSSLEENLCVGPKIFLNKKLAFKILIRTCE
jgi:hypothetical protein